MTLVIVILLGAAVVALFDGAVLQAIGIAAFAGLLIYLDERSRARGGGGIWIGFGWGRAGWRQ